MFVTATSTPHGHMYWHEMYLFRMNYWNVYYYHIYTILTHVLTFCSWTWNPYFRINYWNVCYCHIYTTLTHVLTWNVSFQDELLECLLLPHLHHIDTDPDSEVRARAARLLVDITMVSQSQLVTELLDLLRKVKKSCFSF